VVQFARYAEVALRARDLRDVPSRSQRHRRART